MTKAENPKNSPFAIASILVQMDSIELTRFEVAEYPFEACFLNLTPSFALIRYMKTSKSALFPMLEVVLDYFWVYQLQRLSVVLK